MDLVFADDSEQLKPTRCGMGPLVSIGGIHVPSDKVRDLEMDIDKRCKYWGFPDGEEFKYSPSKGLWMRENLIGEDRHSFFMDVLALLYDYDVTAMVALEDTDFGTATDATSHKEDVAWLFLERVNMQLSDRDAYGIVIFDRPGGSVNKEDELLAKYLDTLLSGTRYVHFDHIALNVLCTSSHLVRLLQAADLIASCTTQYIAGEGIYSPPLFKNGIMPLLRCKNNRVGGVGVKLHPDSRYDNLYHWLLCDQDRIREGYVESLPILDKPYCDGADAP